ncbi:hypothetical protein [Streptomyces physcomitrii]|uniref:Uncharacterized protein n=1 Tax=Streptomyces physcomitrii TaxID=2724184 RepID=A0ABX1H0U2_9ACTN|nr:hypothetical protein [Streptomyces physcomitrii]NKI41628.1 hypothetical protein [Streptomyces physcomitrii]
MASGFRLVANKGKSFQGSNVLGKGFILTPEQADDLIQRDPRNRDVLFPYLNGEDLNSRPDCSASRWVINFHDWSEERARSYPEVFTIVERDVKPERLKNNRKVRRERWWQYAERAPKLYQAIKGLDRILVVAQTSRTQMPARVPVGPVFDQKLVVFPRQGTADLCFRASSFQYLWTLRMGSTRTADLVFTPSTCSETLPQPQNIDSLQAAGDSLEAVRNSVMLDRQIGLTKLYTAMHDPAVTDSFIEDLRNAHSAVDRMVAQAYKWADLDIECGFHPTPQGLRYTFNPAVQSEILDRILELNHNRHHLESIDAGGDSGERSMGSRCSRSHSGDDALF